MNMYDHTVIVSLKITYLILLERLKNGDFIATVTFSLTRQEE